MMRVENRSLEDLDKESWSKLEGHALHLGIFQTHAWAQVLNFTGIEPRFLTIFEKGTPIAGLLTFKSKLAFSLFDAYEARDAMLLTTASHVDVDSVVACISSSLRDMSRSPRTLYVTIYSAPILSTLLSPHFQKENLPTGNDATFIIDLSSPIEVLEKGVRKTARRLVRRAEEQGVTVKDAKDWSTWKSFYQMYCDDCQRLKLRPHSLRLHRGIYDFLSSRGMAKLFIAMHDGKIIAGRLLLLTPHLVLDYEAAYDPSYRMLNPNDVIYWHIIHWAKGQGIRYFDLGGTIPRPTKDSYLYGVHRFKKKWGGNLIIFDYFNYGKLYLYAERFAFRSENFSRLYYLLERLNMINRFDRT